MEIKKSRSFQDLLVWQKAHSIVLEIYRLSENFPKTETYGLTSQIRRAAVSIAANIAEGFKKKGKLDKVRFFNIAAGSLEEVKYYIILSQDLGYINNSTIFNSLEEVGRMLESYSKSVLISVQPS